MKRGKNLFIHVNKNRNIDLIKVWSFLIAFSQYFNTMHISDHSNKRPCNKTCPYPVSAVALLPITEINM